MLTHVSKNLFAQTHRGKGYRNRTGANRGFGAHLFGDRKRMLEQAVELLTNRTRRAGFLISIFDLAENLRLT